MAYETFVPLFHEIFTKVNNAKDKTKKMEVLRKYQTPALEQFLKAAFDPNIEWMLPEGDVPYIKNDAPDGTDHTRLSSEAIKLYHFVKLHRSSAEDVLGDARIQPFKREQMFIQLLESLSEGEAECVILAKNKNLNRKYKGLNSNTVRDAFGWNETFSGRA